MRGIENSNYRPKSVQEQNASNKSESPDLISRRKFLYGTMAAATLVATHEISSLFKETKNSTEKSSSLFDFFKKKFPEIFKDSSAEQGNIDEVAHEIADIEKEFDIEKMPEYDLSPEEEKRLRDIFDYHKDVNLNMDKRNLILKSWKDRYANNSLYQREFEKSYERMEPYKETLQDFFQKIGVPKEMIYLSIPESYADTKAVSHKGARGFFQFTAQTGRQYGLRIDRQVDERLDPIKSGKACGLFLKDLHKELGDWDLAIYAYNGGFARRYAKKEIKSGKKPSEKEFLEYMENMIKEVRNKVKNTFDTHAVRKGDTLSKIAKEHSVKLEDLQKYNHIDLKKGLQKGQKIKIPISEKNKERFYYDLNLVRGFSENLNYLGKVRAVLDIIDKTLKT